MARTPSNMISLGSEAPDFNLPDVNSETNISLKDYKGKIGTVIMFICNHCPYVKHVNPTITKISKKHHGEDIKFVAISSNDVVNYPDDSPEKMKINAIENDFIFCPVFLASRTTIEVTKDESRPPERSTPSGASLINLFFTALISNSSNLSGPNPGVNFSE